MEPTEEEHYTLRIGLLALKTNFRNKKKTFFAILYLPVSNGRSRVFNLKLGCFVMCTIARPIQARPSLKLKTRPKFFPVNLSLSMLNLNLSSDNFESRILPCARGAQTKYKKLLRDKRSSFFVCVLETKKEAF